MHSLGKRLLRLALIAMLTPVALLLSCQSSFIYHPRPNEPGMIEHLKNNRGVRITYRTSQGKQTAWYLPPYRGSENVVPPLWIAFSGNGSLALDWMHFAGIADGRFAWLMIDYPGYGECEGKPTPKAIRQSSVAALNQLAMQLKVPREILISRSAVIGHSLGAAAALMAAEDLGIHRGILISPFTSMTDMCREVLGWPFCLLNLHHFDNRQSLAAASRHPDAQFTIYHGMNDRLIPMRMSTELASAHPGKVILHPCPGGHNDVLLNIQAQLQTEMHRIILIDPTETGD
ncbi:MAG: alpha/beta fold hydrolase [Prosthecobacter sp.]